MLGPKGAVFIIGGERHLPTLSALKAALEPGRLLESSKATQISEAAKAPTALSAVIRDDPGHEHFHPGQTANS